jgi:HD-like signal output (HDOD) protein
MSPGLVEEVLLGFHCELGAQLAQSWNLGERICTVIRDHHAWDAAVRSEDVRLVWLADALAHLACGETSSSSPEFSASTVKRLGLGKYGFETLLGMRESVARFVEAFF